MAKKKNGAISYDQYIDKYGDKKAGTISYDQYMAKQAEREQQAQQQAKEYRQSFINRLAASATIQKARDMSNPFMNGNSRAQAEMARNAFGYGKTYDIQNHQMVPVAEANPQRRAFNEWIGKLNKAKADKEAGVKPEKKPVPAVQRSPEEIKTEYTTQKMQQLRQAVAEQGLTFDAVEESRKRNKTGNNWTVQQQIELDRQNMKNAEADLLNNAGLPFYMSEEKRKALREESVKTAQEKRKLAEEYGQFVPEEGMAGLYDYVHGLDVKNEENIINNPAYKGTDFESTARSRLAELNGEYNQNRRNVETLAGRGMDGWTDPRELSGYEAEQARARIYDDIMPDTYKERVQGMTYEQKKALDDEIDKAYAGTLTPWGESNQADAVDSLNREASAWEAQVNAIDEAQNFYDFIQRKRQLAADEWLGDVSQDYDPAINPGAQMEYDMAIGDYVMKPQGSNIDQAAWYANNWQNMGGMEDKLTYAGKLQYVNKYMFIGANPEILDMFNKFYNKDKKIGSNLTEQFLQGLEPYLISLMVEYQNNLMQSTAQDGVKGTALRAISPALQAVGGVSGTLAAITGQDLDSDLYLPSRIASQTRSRQNEDISKLAAQVFGETGGEVTNFMLGVVDSIADNVFAMNVGTTLAGEGTNAAMRLVQAIMSGSATSNRMVELLEKNVKPAEAAVYAVGDGIIEWLTERYSLERIMGPDVKQMLGNKKAIASFVARSAAAEGSEEINSGLLNTGLDYILSMVFNHEDELKQKYNQLVTSGMSDTEASSKVLEDKLAELGMEGLAGAISGSMMAESRVISSAIDNRGTGKKISGKQGGTNAMLDIAQGMAEGTESRKLAEDLKTKIEAGEEVSDKDLGRLAKLTSLEADEQYKNKSEAALKESVMQEMEGKDLQGVNPEEVTQVIVKAIKNGSESLSKAERSLLLKDTVLNIYKNYLGDTEQTAKAIGAQLEATEGERKAQKSLAELFENKPQSVDTGSRIVKGATAEDIRLAEQVSEHVKTGTEVLLDGEFKQLDGVEIAKDKDGKLTMQAVVGGQVVPAAAIKATSAGVGRVLGEASLSPEFFSKAFVNTLLDAAAQGQMDNEKAMTDAKKIRLYAYAGFQMPDTGLEKQLANRLYMESTREHAENRKAQTGEGNRKAEGRITFDGVEYGTEEYKQKVKGLTKAARAQMDAIAGIAQRAGIEVDFTDLQDTKVYGSESKKGIRINIGGLNYGAVGEEATGQHNMVVTFGHEMTHWLQRNSAKGYNRLEQFVMQEYRQANGEEELARRINHHMYSWGLSLEDAMSEIVADSCDQILADENVMRHIENTDRSLFTEVKNFVTNLVDRIKQAVKGMSGSASKDARAMMQSANELAKVWLGAYDEALTGAVQTGAQAAAEGQERLSQAEADDRYMQAVENGNTEEQQRLVEQAAEIALADSKMRTEDGKLRVLYHGTNSDDFTVFDDSYIGTGSGDSGYFGRGFYFAYSEGEAGFYGRKIKKAYLDIKKPFNYTEQLRYLDGKKTDDYNASRAVFVTNFAEKFPELANDHIVSVWKNGEDTATKLSLKEFADEYRKLIKDKKFTVEKVESDGEIEYLTYADKHKESYTDDNGKVHSWYEYGYQRRNYTEEAAKDQLLNAYDYMANNVYDSISIQNPTIIIMETDFSNSVKKRGYDGIIQSADGDEAVVFDSSQIKLADPVTYDDNGDVIPLSERFNQEQKDIRYSMAELDDQYKQAMDNGDTEEQQRIIDQAADNAGYTIRAYHGTGRADRVGTVFLPERSTSGPMAFFTDTRAIAENYARDKKDTSIAYDEEYGDYYTQFRIKTKNGKTVPVGKLWNTLSFAERQKITEAAKHITFDDEAEEIIYDEDAEYGVGNFSDYERKLHGWNSIDTLIDGWLESGNLWNREEDFLKVLELAGIKDVIYNNPDARIEKVYDTYLKISNPFDTATMYTNEFVDGLLEWWEDQDQEKYDKESMDADFWDKNNISVEEWAEDARDDIKEGSTHVWTRIPDAVSDYLKSLGYDGIKDAGGKGGGIGHTVWIPFTSEQVKSAEPVTYDDEGNVIPPSERFNPEKKDIRWSRSEDSYDVEAWLGNMTPSGLQTEDERILMENFKGLRVSMSLALHKQVLYQSRIKELENRKVLDADARHELETLRQKLDGQKWRMEKLEREMAEVTSSEGYAGMMHKHNMLFKDFISGKTQEQVTEKADQLVQQVKAANKEIEKQRAELNKLAQTQAVKTMKSYLGKSSLQRMTDVLRKTYSTNLPAEEVSDRLAFMALKLADGQDIRADAEALAWDLRDQMRGRQDDTLDYLRGTTFVIGESLANELRAENSSIGEQNEKLRGSGVRLVVYQKDRNGYVADKKSRIKEQWNDLREKNNSLEEYGPQDIDVLHGIVDMINKAMEDARADNQKKVDMEQAAAMVYASAASVTTYFVNDPEAKKQIRNLMTQIRDISDKTGDIADRMKALESQLNEAMLTATKVKGWSEALQADMKTAINYYNKTAAVAAQTERQKVKEGLIKLLKSENTKKLIAQQEKYRQLMRDDQEARETAQKILGERFKINTNIKWMKNRLTAETDQKNIPEEAKPLARMISKMLVLHDQSAMRKVLLADSKQLVDFADRLKRMDQASGEFEPERDLDFLVIKAPNAEDNDYTLRDRAWQDLMAIESGLLEYRSAEGQGKVSLKDREAALRKVREAVSELTTVIKRRGEAFISGKRYEVAALAEQFENEAQKSGYKGERRGRGSKQLDAMERALRYGNLTPEYFIKNLRNGVMNLLYRAFHDAEQNSGLEARDAQERIAKIAEENGFASWDGQQKHTIKVNGGREITITTEQLMALYATWMREKNQMRPEKTAHLLQGGFVLTENDTDKGKTRREIIERRPVRMKAEQLDALGNELTDQQRAYVTAIVEYMSTDLAEIGNKASMDAYGIRKFTEKYYFPIKSWGGVLNRSSDKGVTSSNDNKAMRQSFSRRVQANAQNAIEISDFTPTAVKHIVGMITYNTVGPAVENLNKMLNQQLTFGEKARDEAGEVQDDDTYKVNMGAAFKQHYGQAAYDYLVTFMKDINGGITQRMESSLREKLLTLFKKNAVAGSLSVAAQQPLSYIRAAVMINPKYLAAALLPANWKGSYAEMMKYSGVAIIKKMGKFDMNYGRSMIDYITPEGMQKNKARAAYEWISEKSTSLPEKMDAITWARMWEAVKLEQAAQNKGVNTGSEAFLKQVAERFNEVMRRTQVYDSVMVKSQNMRSDKYLKKVATSFMAEPTLSLNVLADAWQNIGQPGGKKAAAKALATFMLSAAAQAGAKAFFGAGRSPDKKKTKKENWYAKFISNLLSEANPLGLIPGYSQMISVLEAGELKDDAMGVIGKAVDSIDKIFNLATGGAGKKGLYRDLEDSLGQLAQYATNIPVKNFMRDFRAMVNWFSGGTAGFTGDTYAQRETSPVVMKYQMLDTLVSTDLIGIVNGRLGEAGYDTTAAGYVKRLYEAQKTGDKKRAEEMNEFLRLAHGREQKTINSQVNTLVKDDTSTSAEEKQKLLQENEYGSMSAWVIEQYRKGEIDRKTADRMYREERQKATDKDVLEALDKVDYEKRTGKKPESYSNYMPLYDAIEENKENDIKAAIKYMLDNGYTAKDIKTQLTTKYKAAYLAADQSGKRRIRDALQKAYKALGYTATDADKIINGWKKK